MKGFPFFYRLKYLMLLMVLISALGNVKAQVTVVYADPAVGSFDITDLSDNSVNANALQLNSIYKLKLDVLNLDLANAIPDNTAYVEIGLGSKLILAPGFDLNTAPYNNYFTFTYITGSQPKIRCTLHAPLPASFAGQLVFYVKANIQGAQSTVTGNFYVSNNNPGYILSDIQSGNNDTYIFYTVGPEAPPLPVVISNFTAHNKDCRIEMNWSVARELNLAKYEVELSKNGIDFVMAAPVPATGASAYSTAFAITEQLKAAVLLVRLKYTDKDGTFNFGPIVSVSGTCAGKEQQDIYCFPNPLIANDHITIAYRAQLFNGTYQISLVDVSGRICLITQMVINSTSSFRVELVKELPAGRYFIILHKTGSMANQVLQFEKS